MLHFRSSVYRLSAEVSSTLSTWFPVTRQQNHLAHVTDMSDLVELQFALGRLVFAVGSRQLIQDRPTTPPLVLVRVAWLFRLLARRRIVGRTAWRAGRQRPATFAANPRRD